MGRCGNESGCCGLQGGCTPDNMTNLYPYGLCTLKHQPSLTIDQAINSPYPYKYYDAGDVLKWPMWPGQSNQPSTQSWCKAFTSGVALILPLLLPTFHKTTEFALILLRAPDCLTRLPDMYELHLLAACALTYQRVAVSFAESPRAATCAVVQAEHGSAGIARSNWSWP